MAINPNEIKKQVKENSNRLKVLEKKVDENKSEIIFLKTEINQIHSDIKILLSNDGRIMKGLERIENKIPSPWHKRLKWWHYVVAIIIILTCLGVFVPA